jgi:subtilisin family serine protease
VVPGRYIVKLRNGASSNFTARHLIRSSNVVALGSELRSNVSGVSQAQEFRNLGIVVVDGNSDEVRQALDGHPLVDYFEPEIAWEVASGESPNLPAGFEGAPWMRDMLGLNNASPDPNIGYTGSNPVTVAVIDTGADTTHPYLTAGLSVNASEAAGSMGVDDDGNGYVDDLYGGDVFTRNGAVDTGNTEHGTHVAGLVKAVRDQSIPSVPEAAAVRIMPVRFIGASGLGSTASAIQALEYAVSRGAKVVNASWGAKGVEAFSRALYDSMVELYNRDVFFAVAAGNAESAGPNNNDLTPYFPASFNIPALLSVASVTPVYAGSGASASYRDFYLSSFSNYGQQSVHLAAPGDMLNDGGSGVISARAGGGTANPFLRKRGTSMATPVVAGVAAVVRAINPSLTNYEVRELLYNTVTKSAKLATSVSSAGVLNAAEAYRVARSAVSQGLRPAVTPMETPKLSSSAADSSSSGGGGAGGSTSETKRKSGGCGAVTSVNGGEGPGGGNSLGLFTIAYFVFRALRKSKAGGLKPRKIIA